MASAAVLPTPSYANFAIFQVAGQAASACATNSFQNASLLSSYAKRPAFNVPGVDFCVGVQAGVTLSDPVPGGTLAAGLTALGCSGTTTITCTGTNCNNATIQGWDFSLHNGVSLTINNCTGTTIKNNFFQVGSNLNQPIQLSNSANGITIENNEFNGAGLENDSNVGFGLIEANAFGTNTIQFNYLHDAFSELLVFGNSATGNNSIYQVQNNALINAGLGQPQGAHGDWSQIVAGNAGASLTEVTFDHNLGVQTNATSGVGAQGFSYNGNPGGTFSNSAMTNNVVISKVSGAMVTNTFFNYDVSRQNNNVTVSGNYMDRTSVGNAPDTPVPNNWIGPAPGSGAFSAATTCSGNFDMVAGTAVTGTFNSFNGISVTCN